MSHGSRSYAAVSGTFGLTQTDIARQIHLSQGRASAVERGDLARTEVGTIAAYVQALGGQLG